MKLPSLLLMVIVSSSVLIGQSRAQGPIAPIRGWFSNIMSTLGRAAGLVTTVTVYDTTTMTTTVTVTATGQQGILGVDALLEETTLSDELLDSTISSVSDSTAGQDAVAPDSSPVIISITTSSAATPFRNTTTFATTIPKTTTVKSTSVTKVEASVSKTTSSVVKTTAPKTSSSSTKSSVAKTTTSSLILAVRQGSRFFASLRKPKDEEYEDLAAEDSDIVLSPSKVLTVEHSAAAQMPYVIKRSVDIESSLMASNQHRKSVLASYSATD